LAELLVELLDAKNAILVYITMLRVLRIVRMVRLLRILRTSLYFREFRLMLFSLMSSVKSLFWVAFLFSFIFYTFSVSIAWSVHRYISELDAERLGDGDVHQLMLYFGSLSRAVLTLFQAITGGQDWSVFYESLADVPLAQEIFIGFIFFSVFAALNVVNGLFVELAMRSSAADREMIIQDELDQKDRYLQSMARLFEEMDSDNSGYITQAEFEKQIDDERAIAYFNSLKLDVSEAKTLFTLLDIDQSGHVDVWEFLVGCEKLKGEARSLDMHVLQYQLRWLMHAQQGFADFVEDRLTQLTLRANRERSSGPLVTNSTW